MNIQDFADLVHEHRREYFAKRELNHLSIERESDVRLVHGKKYTKLDVGPMGQWSGKLMIDAEGNIFGIKAYGVIHRGHYYGTLETVNDWFWGDYAPVRRSKLCE